MNNSRPEEILQYLTSGGSLLAVTHFFPDGDAVGSLLAFGGILEHLGQSYVIAVDDACPPKYSFLPGFSRIVNLRLRPLEEIFDRVVVLDAGALARVGSAQQCIGPRTRILNIDHHFTGQYYGHLNLVDANASATAELLYRLCRDLNIPLHRQIAYGLFVGILTDTGRFRFGNTTADAFRICGELVAAGVDPGWVTENVFFNMPLTFVQALARALSTLELHYGGLVCLLELNRSDYINDTEGFVEYAASIQGVALAAFICELDENLFKVSLRSRSPVDVSLIARNFGGGGHLKAAGFRFRGQRDVLVSRLLAQFKQAIDEHHLVPGEKFTDWIRPDGLQLEQVSAGWVGQRSLD